MNKPSIWLPDIIAPDDALIDGRTFDLVLIYAFASYHFH